MQELSITVEICTIEVNLFSEEYRKESLERGVANFTLSVNRRLSLDLMITKGNKQKRQSHL